MDLYARVTEAPGVHLPMLHSDLTCWREVCNDEVLTVLSPSALDPEHPRRQGDLYEVSP